MADGNKFLKCMSAAAVCFLSIKENEMTLEKRCQKCKKRQSITVMSITVLSKKRLTSLAKI